MTIPEVTGIADFPYGAETYKTWYKVFGDLKSGKTPLVTLHGGPGAGHFYMQLHKHLWEREKIPVICYDQIGNGASTHLQNAPKEFWTPSLFMDELENLLKHLEIGDKFDLVGQSWGGMFAGQFAAERQPKGLRRVILANPPASIPLYVKGINELLAREFPAEFVTMLRKHEEEGTITSKEYEEGTMVFLKRFLCTSDPWPEDLVASMQLLASDPTVYGTMLGPSEFCVTGTLKEWDIINIMHKIIYPTLLISSRNDTVSEECTLPWFQHVPKIKWVELANSTHMGMFEETDRYLDIVHQFLV